MYLIPDRPEAARMRYQLRRFKKKLETPECPEAQELREALKKLMEMLDWQVDV
jgi:hypothetical protein